MLVGKKRKNISKKAVEEAENKDRQQAAEPIKQPDGLVVYDPDTPLYERGHVCVLLAKVMETLHSE